jgi:CheY-like chemotaxis protein
MAQKVLLIDDDVDFQEAITTLLEAKGYSVASAGSGSEGFALAQKQLPGLVLLDMMMGRRTEGLDTLKKLQSDPATRDIPVILVTGIKRDMNMAFDLEPDEQSLPVKAVLEKPVKPEKILAAVAEHIRKA